MANDTVLVTGGAGFLGSHLVDSLVKTGCSVTVIDNLSSGKKRNVNKAADLVEADIRSVAARETIEKLKPGVVFHAAAQISVSVSARDPLLDADVNIMGGLNIMQGAAAAKVRKVVFVSTGGAMYGDAERIPTDEANPSRPLSPYGTSKFAFENYLRVFKHLHGIEYAVVRPGNIYGPRQDPHGEAGVVAIFTQSMLAGRNCRIFGDGTDERDYVYAGDVADLLIRASRGAGPGPYNAGTGRGTSVNTLFRTLAQITGYTLHAEHVAPRPGDLRRSVLDSNRAASDLGWKPVVSLEEGLRRTVEYFKANG